jgi:hypothetical protein
MGEGFLGAVASGLPEEPGRHALVALAGDKGIAPNFSRQVQAREAP